MGGGQGWALPSAASCRAVPYIVTLAVVISEESWGRGANTVQAPAPPDDPADGGGPWREGLKVKEKHTQLPGGWGVRCITWCLVHPDTDSPLRAHRKSLNAPGHPSNPFWIRAQSL